MCLALLVLVNAGVQFWLLGPKVVSFGLTLIVDPSC